MVFILSEEQSTICFNWQCFLYVKTYHFAGDTSAILSSTSLQILSKQINKDLFNLSNWLKANKSLKVKKTELVIFRSRKLKIDSSFKFKLDGNRLVPTNQ